MDQLSVSRSSLPKRLSSSRSHDWTQVEDSSATQTDIETGPNSSPRVVFIIWYGDELVADRVTRRSSDRKAYPHLFPGSPSYWLQYGSRDRCALSTPHEGYISGSWRRGWWRGFDSWMGGQGINLEYRGSDMLNLIQFKILMSNRRSPRRSPVGRAWIKRVELEQANVTIIPI